ncbi:hypothetical protein JRQ81_017244 [Phrynocephalus forsythii]|uniref:TGF-beta family profile domain-containing protein n=1 Tax=Phrynocephalus forsythii TaxID=171643 RepID=A0A9Q1AZG4_9SAUR|nr:hypothetical protein JRQ81_017244 [Phrynocephalus forsythii]
MHPPRLLLFFLLLLLLLLLDGLAAAEGSRPGAGQLPSSEKRCAPSSSPLPAYMVNLSRSGPPQADVVRSLRPQSVHQVGQRWSVVFNLSACQPAELELAELRLHLPSSEENSVFSGGPVWVDLYHQQVITCPSGLSSPHPIHVGSFAVPPSLPSSWRVLEVTEQLIRWAMNSSLSEEAIQKMLCYRHPHTKHLPMQVANHCESVDRTAFLVLFSRLPKEEKELNSSTLLQTAKSSKFFTLGTSKDIPFRGTKRHRRHKKRNGLSHMSLKELATKTLCHRVDFYVDFEEIGWGSWIIYPKRYNAFRCDGKCPVPLEEKFLPTNYAYMQSVLKYYHPERVPAACCIPVSLSPLSLLYYEDGKVSLGHHEDMIVEECGCR